MTRQVKRSQHLLASFDTNYPPQLLLPEELLLQLDLAETEEPKPPREMVRLTVGFGFK